MAGEVVVVGKKLAFVDDVARLPPGIPVLTLAAPVLRLDLSVLGFVVTLVTTVAGPG